MAFAQTTTTLAGMLEFVNELRRSEPRNRVPGFRGMRSIEWALIRLGYATTDFNYISWLDALSDRKEKTGGQSAGLTGTLRITLDRDALLAYQMPSHRDRKAKIDRAMNIPSFDRTALLLLQTVTPMRPITARGP